MALTARCARSRKESPSITRQPWPAPVALPGQSRCARARDRGPAPTRAWRRGGARRGGHVMGAVMIRRLVRLGAFISVVLAPALLEAQAVPDTTGTSFGWLTRRIGGQ